MAFTFPAEVAWDPTTRQQVKNVSFQVFATADTTFSTPLTITDPFGNPIPGNLLNSGTQGVFPQFQHATQPAVVIADATKTYAWTIPCVLQDAAVAAFAANPASALAGQLGATFALKTDALANTQILADTDGAPYFQPPTFALDTDGTPYYDANGVPTASAISVRTDTDAAPYFA